MGITKVDVGGHFSVGLVSARADVPGQGNVAYVHIADRARAVPRRKTLSMPPKSRIKTIPVLP